MKNNFEVSIIVVVKNHEKFLGKCLKSICSQSFKNYKLIIIDNNSRDNSLRIAQSFQRKLKKKIKIINNEKNKSLNYLINGALKQIESEFFILFSGDDYFKKNKLLTQTNFLKNHPEIDVCSHNVLVEDAIHNVKYLYNFDDISKIKNFNTNQKFLIERGFISPLSFMYRSKAIIPNFKFNKNLKFVSDWLFNCEISKTKNYGYIHKDLCVYRRHPESYTSKNFFFDDYLKGYEILYKKKHDLKSVNLGKLIIIIIYFYHSIFIKYDFKKIIFLFFKIFYFLIFKGILFKKMLYIFFLKKIQFYMKFHFVKK